MTDASSRRSPIDSDGMAVAGQAPSDRSFNAKSRFDRAGIAAISALTASASLAAVTYPVPSSRVSALSRRISAAARSAASCSMLVMTGSPDASIEQPPRFIFLDYEGTRAPVRRQARSAFSGRRPDFDREVPGEG